jgi:hypothetical protein
VTELTNDQRVALVVRAETARFVAECAQQRAEELKAALEAHLLDATLEELQATVDALMNAAHANEVAGAAGLQLTRFWGESRHQKLYEWCGLTCDELVERVEAGLAAMTNGRS